MSTNIIVKAGAGTGKTFCVTEGVHRLLHSPRKTIGSTEQQAVWDEMLKDKYPGSIHMTSFTTDAADQLESKCPVDHMGKRLVTSSSTYGMGLRFAKQCGHAGSIDRWGHKYKALTSEFLGGTKYECDQKNPGVWNAIHSIQDKARLGLFRWMNDDDVAKIANHFGIDFLPSQTELVTRGVNAVLEGGREKNWQYDYTDMVYIPVIRGLVTKRYDTLVVDEFQDMGRAQQELCLMISRKQILIGDPHQAIYGFAGADQDAFDRLEKWLAMTQRGVSVLPLNETRRCAKAIVAEANRLVPELKAMASAKDGKVIKMRDKHEFYKDFMPEIKATYGSAGHITNDMMIICPTNAPLISLMFKLQKQGVRSFVHGKDITDSMQTFVSKFDHGIEELRRAIEKKLEDILQKRHSKSKDLQLDIYTALQEIAREVATVDAVSAVIRSVFSDTPRPGWLKLSSIHKSKGLEADTIVIWEIDKCKSGYSTLPWQHLQDKNLEYVGITRAKNTLVLVRSGR